MMDRGRSRPRRLHRSTWVILGIALVSATMMLPSGAWAGSFAVGGEPSTPGELTAATVLPSFAERAGYSSLWASEAQHVAPSAGTQSLEVTFSPTNATFYDTSVRGGDRMTVAQIADAYGLSPTAYSTAEQYFESQGLSVLHSWPDRLSLSLTGTTADVDRAFDTSLLSGTYQGDAVTFPGSPPSLPSELETEVQSVSGLTAGFDRFTLPETPALPTARTASTPAQGNPSLVTPAIARDIYDVSGLYNLTANPTYATGEGIVLLIWGEGYAPTDLQTFFANDYPSGFPAPRVVPYPVDGAPSPSPGAPNDPSNGSRELTLDIEWSGSMAPGATLDAVYAPPGPPSNGYSPTDPSMIDALNTAVDPSDVPGVSVISMSFGSADGGDSTLTDGFQNDFAIAAHEGISLFAATGDTGGDAGSGCSGGPQPEYPSTSPQVVAVGGTAVTISHGPLGGVSGFSEAAWSDGGGGYSTQFAAPSWQEVGSAAAPISANGHRATPDVAATADYNFLYFDSEQLAGGGTSFATPLWAGMVAEMDALRGTNFGFMTPQLYQLAAGESTANPAFNDITKGANCLGPAKVGWDTATGWGSPVAVLLYEHLVSSFVNLSVSASPSPVAPGGVVTITATVTNATSGAPIAGVSAVVVLASTGIGGPCSGTFGSVTPASNSTGQLVATISIPGCYLGSQAQATVTVAGHGYYGVATATVNVNLIGLIPALAGIAQYPGNVVFFVVVMAAAVVVGGLLGRRVGAGRPEVAPAPAASLAPPPLAPSAPPEAAEPPSGAAVPPQPPG
jgi:kumamolisin